MVWFLCLCGRIFCARKQGRRSNFSWSVCATLVAHIVAFDTVGWKYNIISTYEQNGTKKCLYWKISRVKSSHYIMKLGQKFRNYYFGRILPLIL